MARPKLSCDYELFTTCRQQAVTRITAERKRDRLRHTSQYCAELSCVVCGDPLEDGDRIFADGFAAKPTIWHRRHGIRVRQERFGRRECEVCERRLTNVRREGRDIRGDCPEHGRGPAWITGVRQNRLDESDA